MPWSYIWLKVNEGRISKYTMGTWSRRDTLSEIQCPGTPGDIARLPCVGRCSKADQSKRYGWKIQKTTVRWVVSCRQRKQVDPLVGIVDIVLCRLDLTI